MAGSGKKLALLVGCNYPNTPNELKGCYNDVQNMNDILTSRFGFDFSDIVILTDETDPNGAPAEDIKNQLKTMVAQALKGDILFFYFSGQGVKIKSDTEAAIVASDLKHITPVELKEIVDQLPEQVVLTIMSDSSHSEGQFGNSQHGILLSACRLAESRHEITDVFGNYYGAFSNAVQNFLKDHPPCPPPPVTNEGVSDNAGKILHNEGIKQQPRLHCPPLYRCAKFLGYTGGCP